MFLPVPGNANYSNIDVYVPMTGANGSTAFPSIGNKGVSFSANGHVQISTAQSKWGGGSGYFDGELDWIDGNFGSALGPLWTIEFWVYMPSLSKTYGIFSIGAEGSFGRGLRILINSTGTIMLFGDRDNYGNNGYFRYSAEGAVTTNTWEHVAFVKTASNSAPVCYVNGSVSSGSSSWYTNTLFYSNYYVYFGAAMDGGVRASMLGYANDLHISNNALYSGAFTPAPLGVTPIDTGPLLVTESSVVTAARLGQ